MATVKDPQSGNYQPCQVTTIPQEPNWIVIQLQDNTAYMEVLAWGKAVVITDDKGKTYNTKHIIDMIPDKFEIQYNLSGASPA